MISPAKEETASPTETMLPSSIIISASIKELSVYTFAPLRRIDILSPLSDLIIHNKGSTCEAEPNRYIEPAG